MRSDPSGTARRRRLAAVALLLATGTVAVAVRAVGPTLDRLAWAASIDPSAHGAAEVVRQQGRSDCGPAALKMILDHHGITGVTLAELEVATETGPDGTSMLALKRTAEQRGLASQGLRLPVARLHGIPMPAIAHVHGDHFVVLRQAGSKLIIDDPSLGRLRMSAKTFERSWDGVVLAFTGRAHRFRGRNETRPFTQNQQTPPKGEQPSNTHPNAPSGRFPASALQPTDTP